MIVKFVATKLPVFIFSFIIFLSIYLVATFFRLRNPKDTSIVSFERLAEIERRIREGRINPDGHRVLKIVMMTRNEYPLIVSWIEYHGKVYGFENLYIIDASDEPKVIAALKSAEKLGVSVNYSHANLNEVQVEIDDLMKSLVPSCDLVIKLDTDEFIAYYNPITLSLSTDRNVIMSYLDSLAFDGRKYTIGYYAINTNVTKGCIADNPVKSFTTFALFPWPKFKVIVPAATFHSMDLGGHVGTVVAPYNGEPHNTNITIFHYHNHCYQRLMTVTKQAIMRHNYIHLNQSASIQIEILTHLSKGYPKVCNINSCHKVFGYLQHLLDPELSELNYIKGVRAMERPGVRIVSTTLVKDLLVT